MKLIPQAYAQTQTWTDINENCVNGGVATIQGLGCMLANILSVTLTILGIAGFIMMIYAAFNMMIMGGNSQATEKSKSTITFAIVGIILALSSFIIINLISEFTGIDAIKNFSIPGSGKDWNTTAPALPNSSGSPDDRAGL
jgi:phage shock protein PspC (stress-responsive transcriptional regulator)